MTEPQHMRLEPMRHRFDLAFGCITDYAIIILDEQRRVSAWNPGAQQTLGYTEAEMLGVSGDIVFTPEDRAAGAPEREQHEARVHGRAEDERWHVRKDGSRFFASGIMTALREHGRLLGFVKIMRDVTDQQCAAEALARSEQRYRLLVESIKDYAIFMLDAEGRVVDWTSAAERILGYPAHEVLGQSFALFFLQEDQQAGVPALELKSVFENGRFQGVGWRVRRDGSRFWGEESATAVYGADGIIQGVSKMTRDITERMLAEAEQERLLRQSTEANRLKDEFLGTISHELRTPLNAIIGWTRMMRDGTLDTAARQRALEVVDRNARSQAQLINDLLDVSRIITGKLTLQIETISLSDVITAALDTVRPASEAKQIRLEMSLDPEADAIAADRERIQQVIWNLLTNAIKFTGNRGHIAIATSRQHDVIEIVCRDSGIGIQPEFLPYVFDRFRQAESGTTRTQTGLGLGLAIVRHLVELHGGTVRAESGGHGAGTTMRVRLPAARAPLAALDPFGERVHTTHPAARADGALDALLNRRVLVVDDDADAREFMVMALTRAGAHVVLAASAEEALRLLDHARPDAIISDIGMPGEDGYMFLHRLQGRDGGRFRDVPVIAVTAYARETDRASVLAAGFRAHFSKPVDLEALVQLVSESTPNTTAARPPEPD
jgi:PAS domain S-box-containing protein